MKKLKAYQVHDGGDHTVIQFATNSATARREGANEMGCEWEEVDYCNRKPEYDSYAPGPVPPLVLIKNGWWFECHHCSTQVNEYNEEDPIPAGDSVFCSAACKAKDFAEQRSRDAALVALEEVFTAKFAGASSVDTYLAGHKLVPSSQFDPRYQYSPYAMVTFNFPGGAGVARWVFGDELVTCLLYTSPSPRD